MNTNTEYTGLNGSKVTNAVTSRRHLVNGAFAGSKAPTTAAVLSAVADSLANAAQKPVANGYYPVYSDITRGSAGYCAWHSYGTIGGVAVQFGFFFDLDGDTRVQRRHTGPTPPPRRVRTRTAPACLRWQTSPVTS